MKKFKYIWSVLSVLAIGCTNVEDFMEANGEGTLRLNVGVNTEVKVSTRSNIMTDSVEAALMESCKIRIYEGSKLIRKYLGTASVPSEGIQMISGAYTATVEAGDSVAASFDKTYYKGSQTFDITSGNITSVDLKGYIRNTLVKVNFDAASLDEVYSDYQVEIGAGKGLLTYSKDDNKTGYYMLSEGVTAFSYTFTATSEDGETKTYEGTALENLKPATLYTVNFRFEDASTPYGGGIITLDIEEEPLVGTDTPVTIYQRPIIVGMYADNSEFDPEKSLNIEPGYDQMLSLWIAFSAPVGGIEMTCDEFITWGISNYATIDMFNMTNTEREELASKGITYKNRSAVGEGATIGIEFSADLIASIAAEEGLHTIHIVASDQQGGKREIDWVINVSDATVVTENVNMMDVYTNRSVLRGSVTKEPEGELSFQYRVAGSSSWTSVSATRSDATATASISNLTANTKYEYRILDGSNPSTVVCSFTTEAAQQPENASFENWSGSTPLLLYGAGQNVWWDSGNHGSATMNKNVTVQGTEYVHSGNYSAKLASQFVGIGIIGKFAAGNAFVGKYIRTDGTDGVLGWGRPFTSRPTALRGYIRYVSATVNYAGGALSEGDNDHGQIFVALGDWAGETDSETGETWPAIVRTKDKHFFDQSTNNTGTIAYGQQTWTESTAGEGLIEFEIPLEYWRTDAKPKSIIMVCSASKYGDYFAGGAGSTMWIDDLEFVYE